VREYSTREVADITGLPASRIRGWAQSGLITPHKDARGHWRFSFQDLALVRTACKLLDHRLSPHRVATTLRQLRDQLPPGRPLSAVRIVVIGDRIMVSDRLSSWEPESRQGTLDFDVQSLLHRVVPRPRVTSTETGEPDQQNAADIYEAALDLELAGRREEARDAYEAALLRDPQLTAARINLGRLLHADNRLAEAEAMYRVALEQEPRNAMAAFNLGVALEDQKRIDAAIDAYGQALDIDDAYADAHFNLSRLLEAKGDKRAALRHLSSFRRLMKGGS
jgi:tetratricopeptide (TPR) repeat protein